MFTNILFSMTKYSESFSTTLWKLNVLKGPIPTLKN